jgi:hypothetical protein
MTNLHQESWWEFKAANPKVWDLFVGFAQELVEKGRRFGVKLLAERVRWEIRTTWAPDDQGFKINNNWTAYIARDLLDVIPRAKDLIETRAVHGGY